MTAGDEEMLCNKCGFQLDELDEFCSGCGAKVEKENETKDVLETDAKVNSKAKEPEQIQGKSRKKALIAIAAIIFVLLVVLILVQIKNKQPGAQQKQVEEQLTDVMLEDAVAAAKPLRTSGDGTDIAVLSGEETRLFHLTQYALLVNALTKMQVDSTKGLQYWINDADMDGSPELLVDGCFSKEWSLSSQLTADADSPIMWGYTATGAAGDSDYSFGRRDNTIYWKNGYYSLGMGAEDYCTWNGNAWVSFCEDSWSFQNSSTEPLHNYVWYNSNVSQQEYEANTQSLLIEIPSADTTDLFNVEVNGNAPELILDYEKYLKENVEGYLGVAFADVDGDGKQEAAFVIQDATKKWWDALTFENSWGDESCLIYWDYGTSIVLAEATDAGITLSAMKLNNPQDEIPGYYAQDMDALALSTFYTKDNELILEVWNASYRAYTNGKTNGLESPCLSYEGANSRGTTP